MMPPNAEKNSGAYKRRIGDVLVTALFDGQIELPPQVFPKVTPQERESLLRTAGRRPPFVSSINTFLLQWPDRTVLIDTGTGNEMGGVGGQMPANLAAAGVEAAAIDAILLTHLHVDHMSGLNDGGSPRFGKARLWVAEPEMAFWHDDAAKAAAPEQMQGAFDAARNAVASYASRTERFAYGSIMPGVEAVSLPGHTPGHTGYLIDGGAEKLLIWGDVMHVQAVQSAKPEVSTAFDTDPDQAHRSRTQICDRAAAEDLLVAGMHLSFPGFYRVVKDGSRYHLHPDIWRPEA